MNSMNDYQSDELGKLSVHIKENHIQWIEYLLKHYFSTLRSVLNFAVDLVTIEHSLMYE